MATDAGEMNEVHAHTAEMGTICVRSVARRAAS